MTIRKWLSIFSTLCLTVGLLPAAVFADTGSISYGISVHGIEVTSDNKDDVLGELDGEAATVTFDPATNTLTLNNASFPSTSDVENSEGTIAWVDAAASNPTICAEGNNTFMQITAYGTGTLNFTGNGRIELSGNSARISAIVDTDLVFDGVTISVETPDSISDRPAIYCKNMTVRNGAEIIATSDSTSAVVLDNNLSVTGDSTLSATTTAENSNGICVWGTGTITIQNSNVTACGTYPGLYSSGNLSIENSGVNAVSSDDAGIYLPKGTLSMKKSNVTAKGYYPGININGNISIENSEVNAVSSDDSGIYSKNGALLMKDSTVTAQGSYPGINITDKISIESSEVNAISSADIGIYSDSGILSMKDSKVSVHGYATGIYSSDALMIENSFVNSVSDVNFGIYATEKLDITGESEVIVSGNGSIYGLGGFTLTPASDKLVEVKVGDNAANAAHFGDSPFDGEIDLKHLQVEEKCVENFNYFHSKTHEHTGGTATCKAKAVCDDCGREYGELDADNHAGNIEVRGARSASCTGSGYTGDTYCLDCGLKIADGRTISSYGHSYNGKWTTDETSHWHECSICGTKTDLAAHTFQWVTDKEATATEKGSRHEECSVCGYKKPAEEIPSTGPAPVTVKLDSRTTNTVKISWSESAKAEGYTVWAREEGRTGYQRVAIISKDAARTYTWKKREPGTKHFFVVKAWIKDENGMYVFSEASNTVRGTTKPEAAKIKKVTANAAGDLKVTLEGPAKGANRYAMCWSRKADFSSYAIGIRTQYTVRTMVKGLKPGTYYIKVRSYYQMGESRVYGDWSEAVAAVVTKPNH